MIEFETVIGLEVHIQLQTQRKIFAPDAYRFGAAPNTLSSAVTAAHPGTLPFLNRRAVECAVRLGTALQCSISRYSYFERKHYFYPDLPKGYQITQDRQPICVGGEVQIGEKNETPRSIRIHHIHMEEDAGKSLHDQHDTASWIDLNRAGVPLLELVTEPDLRSGEEAAQFLGNLRKLVLRLGISDANMEEGSLRCDANISVRRKGDTELGKRVEVKNINSLRFLRKAIEFEQTRQIAMIEQGETVERQTRGYDADKNITFAQRSKELAHDYRYFPEPDLPPVILDDDLIAEFTADMPELEAQSSRRLIQQYNLGNYEAAQLAEDVYLLHYFEQTAAADPAVSPKSTANWLLNAVRALLNEQQITWQHCPLPPQHLAQLIALSESGTINTAAAKTVLLPQMLLQPQLSAEKLAQSLHLIIENDDNFAADLADEVLKKFPNEVKAYQNGKKQLFSMFMGQLMKASQGKITAEMAVKLLEAKLKQSV